MEAYLAIISAYPTVIYSFFVAILSLLVIIGLIGLIDLDIDMDFDVDAESLGGVPGLLFNWGLTGPPITISLLILFITAWTISAFGVLFIYPMIPEGVITYVVGTVILFASFYLSIPVTAQLVKPLAKLFRAGNTVAPEIQLIGKTCTIRTSKANAEFGEAVAINDGAEHIIKVRCSEEISKGSKARIIEFDREQKLYKVVSEQKIQEEIGV